MAMCFHEKERNSTATMYLKDILKGLGFSSLNNISWSSLQKLETSAYEDVFHLFCLGNYIYTHDFDSHLCYLKLSSVWSPYSTCTSFTRPLYLDSLQLSQAERGLGLNSLYFPYLLPNSSLPLLLKPIPRVLSLLCSYPNCKSGYHGESSFHLIL